MTEHNLASFPVHQLADAYRAYRWDSRHCQHGYRPDAFPDFQWIRSLEARFAWTRDRVAQMRDEPPRYLIEEMIAWGGNQNGMLQVFQDGLSRTNFYVLLRRVIRSLDTPDMALAAALCIPGLGLTYSSKLLRFLAPDAYGALDSRIEEALVALDLLRRINRSSRSSMIAGYRAFLELLRWLRVELEKRSIERPGETPGAAWRPADIEMALFAWSERRKPARSAGK